MDFQQAQARFQWLEGQFRAGAINAQQYQAGLSELRVTDAGGRVWMLQEHSGIWFVYTNGGWVAAQPPVSSPNAGNPQAVQPGVSPAPAVQPGSGLYINLNFVANALWQSGWKEIGPGAVEGIGFDLVGTRQSVMKWSILIKTLPMLDGQTAMLWQNNFNYINEKMKSFWWGKGFILCLMAQQVSPDTVRALQSDSFGLFGMIRIRGGGGRILISDQANRQVYGDVPALPYDVHKFTSDIKTILMNNFLQ
jgi:hypothetical protein